MENLSRAIIAILYCVIAGGVLFFVSSCLLSHEGSSKESAARRIVKYLSAGPITLALSLVLSSIYISLSLSEISEQARLEFGLPNDNVWAFIIHAFLHADLFHLLGNVLSLLICGGLVEQRIGRRWFLVLVIVTVIVGGYLSVLTAPIFDVSPSSDGVPVVGFSIVNNAVFVICAYWVILSLLDGWRVRQTFSEVQGWFLRRHDCSEINPLKWSRKANQSAALGILLFMFATSIGDGAEISILGHSIGAIIGVAAVVTHAASWLVLRCQWRQSGPLGRRNGGPPA